MLPINILGNVPSICTRLHGIIQTEFPNNSVYKYDLKSFNKYYHDLTAGLLLIDLEPAIALGRLIENILEVGKPEHIVLYVEESFLFDPALYFKDTLVKGIAYKNQKEELLLACLRIVMLGGFCFPPYDRRLSKHRMAQPNKPKNIAQHSSSSFSRRINRTESKIDKHPCEATLLGLTERQYEVLVLLAQGWPLKTVAKKMRIATATAKTHTEALYRRLGANSRSSAVFAAMEKGAKLGIQRERAATEERG